MKPTIESLIASLDYNAKRARREEIAMRRHLGCEKDEMATGSLCLNIRWGDAARIVRSWRAMKRKLKSK